MADDAEELQLPSVVAISCGSSHSVGLLSELPVPILHSPALSLLI